MSRVPPEDSVGIFMSATARNEAAIAENTGTEGFLSSVTPSQGGVASRPRDASPSIAGFFDYWMNLPRPGGMPDAADFAPAAIARWLPEIILFELASPTIATYRLAGTAVVERLGHNPTGSNLLDLLPEARRAQASRDLHELVTRPCCYHLRYVNSYSSGRIGQMESIYVPLRPPRGGFPRVVAMNAPEGTLGFETSKQRSEVVTGISEIAWIDVGYGTPWR